VKLNFWRHLILLHRLFFLRLSIIDMFGFKKAPTGPPQLPGKSLFGKGVPLTRENMMVLKQLRNRGNAAGYKAQKNRLRYVGKNVSQANNYLSKTNAYGVKTQLRANLAGRVNGRQANVNYVKARFGNRGGLVKAAASVAAGTGSFTNKVSTSMQATGAGIAAGARGAAASTKYQMGALKNKALSVSVNAFKKWQATQYASNLSRIQQNVASVKSQMASIQTIQSQITELSSFVRSINQKLESKQTANVAVTRELKGVQASIIATIGALQKQQTDSITKLRADMEYATRSVGQRTKNVAISAGQGLTSAAGMMGNRAKTAGTVALRAPMRAGQVVAGAATGAFQGARKAATAPLSLFGRGRRNNSKAIVPWKPAGVTGGRI
jgi:hypothetical protein